MNNSRYGHIDHGYTEQRTTAHLSSAERSKVNDAMIAQIAALTQANNELNTRTKHLTYDVATDEWIDPKITTFRGDLEREMVSLERTLNEFMCSYHFWLLTGK